MPRKSKKKYKRGKIISVYIPETASERAVKLINSSAQKSSFIWNIIEEKAIQVEEDCNKNE